MSAIWRAGNEADVERGPGMERVAFNAALNKSLWCKENHVLFQFLFPPHQIDALSHFKAIFKNVSVKSVHKSPVSDISLDVYLGVCCFYRCQHSYRIKLLIISPNTLHLLLYTWVSCAKRKKKKLTVMNSSKWCCVTSAFVHHHVSSVQYRFSHFSKVMCYCIVVL